MESAGHPLAKMLDLSTVGFPGAYLNIKQTTAKQVLRYRVPWMIEDLPKNHWYNWGPPPPGKEIAGPAVTLNRFGNGHALYLAPPLFRLMGSGNRDQLDSPHDSRIHPADDTQPGDRTPHQSAFGIRPRNVLLRQKSAACPGPDPEHGASGYRRRSASRARYCDSSRSRANEGRWRQMVWPQKQDLPLGRQDGKLVVNLPELEVYAAVCLDLERLPS